jgi:heterodisulfide reductase subunit A-like polyferredoxin
MRPVDATTDLAKSLGISADTMGFASNARDLEKNGVFVCGAVTQPMDIEETAVRAIAMASRVPTGREGQ